MKNLYAKCLKDLVSKIKNKRISQEQTNN